MDNSEDYEINRLKKLLEEKILQAEKENMALLKDSTSQKEIVHPVKKTARSCPHSKSPPIIKQDLPDLYSRNVHSHIHFLKDLESSLAERRRNLIHSTKSRYTPCAIQLSPPVRLKKDICEETMYSTNSIQNNTSKVFPSNPKSSMCSKQDFIMIEKNFPFTPVSDRKQNIPTSSKEKAFVEDRRVPHSYYSSPSIAICDRKQNTPTVSENKVFTDEIKNSCQSSSFIQKDNHFPSAENTSFLSRKKLDFSHVQENIPKSKPTETSSLAVDDKKPGLHLQISLDSSSTNDVINKILHKIPEFVKEAETSPFTSNIHSSNYFQQKLKQDKTCQTSDIFNNSPHFSETNHFIKSFKEQNEIISSSAQTDKNNDESYIKKNELHHLVREIVLDVMKNMQFHEHIPMNTIQSNCQKVDSGTQSELENSNIDVGKNFKMANSSLDTLISHGNRVQFSENFNMSKSIQVDLYPVHILKSTLCDKSSNTDSFLQIDEENHTLVSTKLPEGENFILKRNSSPVQDSSKIELMLEKIYDHICQDKDVPAAFSDISPNNPILTRDVAVQYNPLHKSTKSTLTSEIKTVDSYCQYDTEIEDPALQKFYVNASVQTASMAEHFDDCNLQINVYTQCEQKSFLDSVAQTELLLNSEHSATNTSVSSTPVSDSMFMDDLLSEGEISLPWNLRLLSLPGGSLGMNNTDSSDVSTKERDCSLSEGEIHPKVVQYLNMCHNYNSEDTDLPDMFPTKLTTNSKMLYSSSSDLEKSEGQRNIWGKNLCMNVSNSSLSEGELNSSASLSQGEISPVCKVSFQESFFKSENHPSGKSYNKQQSDIISTANCSQMHDASRQSLVKSSFAESGLHKSHEEIFFNNKTVLETVDEEVHSIFN